MRSYESGRVKRAITRGVSAIAFVCATHALCTKTTKATDALTNVRRRTGRTRPQSAAIASYGPAAKCIRKQELPTNACATCPPWHTRCARAVRCRGRAEGAAGAQFTRCSARQTRAEELK